jgi:hypothetical protein
MMAHWPDAVNTDRLAKPCRVLALDAVVDLEQLASPGIVLAGVGSRHELAGETAMADTASSTLATHS